MNDTELESLIGRVALGEYENAEEWDRPKIIEWAVRLRSMPDNEFTLECSSKILDSALMQSFRGNHEGIHCRASACYFEARRRFRAAGHDDDCRGQTLYADGFNMAMRSQGHPVSPPYTCTCGKDKK